MGIKRNGEVESYEKLDSQTVIKGLKIFFSVISQEILRLSKKPPNEYLARHINKTQERIEKILEGIHTKILLKWHLMNKDNRLAFYILLQEIAYFAKTYSPEASTSEELNDFVKAIYPGDSTSDVGGDESNSLNTGGGKSGSSGKDQIQKDAEIIYSSIEKLLDKLPWLLKRLVHVMLEVLRIVGGRTE